MRYRMFLFAATLLGFAAGSAAAAEPVTGWGGLLLGMSVEEAKAARPEFDWDSKSFVDCLSQAKKCSLLADETETKVGKLSFSPSFRFDADGRLEVILLSASLGPQYRPDGQLDNQPPVSRNECHALFRYLMEPLEQKYGPMKTALGGRYEPPSGAGKNDYESVATDIEAMQRSDDHQVPFDAHAELSLIYAHSAGTCDLGIFYLQGFAPSGDAINKMKDQL